MTRLSRKIFKTKITLNLDKTVWEYEYKENKT